jgi:hypothetical protein
VDSAGSAAVWGAVLIQIGATRSVSDRVGFCTSFVCPTAICTIQAAKPPMGSGLYRARFWETSDMRKSRLLSLVTAAGVAGCLASQTLVLGDPTPHPTSAPSVNAASPQPARTHIPGSTTVLVPGERASSSHWRSRYPRPRPTSATSSASWSPRRWTSTALW